MRRGPDRAVMPARARSPPGRQSCGPAYVAFMKDRCIVVDILGQFVVARDQVSMAMDLMPTRSPHEVRPTRKTCTAAWLGLPGGACSAT